MKEPKDLRPGDKCFMVSKDFSVKILEVKEVQGNSSHWINFVEPVSGVFCSKEAKTFTEVIGGKKLFFDKERVLTYLNEKIKKLNKDITKINKT